MPLLNPSAPLRVSIHNAVGLHDLSDEATYRWWLPVLGPSSMALLPLLYQYGTQSVDEYHLDVADAAFMSGMGVGQMAKTLLRLQNFHVINELVADHDEVHIHMPLYLQRISSRMRANWPSWYGRAYDQAFPL